MPDKKPSVHERIVALHDIRILSRADLEHAGLNSKQITAEVRAGRLLRLRNGVYAHADVPAEIAAAVRFGGRVGCLTLLRLIGVFVLERPSLHVHASSRLSRSRRRRPRGATVHWGTDLEMGVAHAVSLVDAVRQAIRCQTPRAAVATLDSVLHHRVLTVEQVTEIFRTLPRRFQALLPLVDPSAESGAETFMRLLLRAIGVPFKTQVQLPGVGRVDFVVAGWLIIECDSREFHEGWDQQVADRARDIAAARLGYMTIRPIASDIFDRPTEVRTAIEETLEAMGRRCGH
ncbi:type IV toxin-antitoxin system AbiEi family antitoxin domain-containing protein [Microbacterium sp. USHLN186]|uniref:type IV toxin-antitoxin system AbiEi family antitoxin domain-containing protein n=1 Tax=Microbacterium sp. USHLN186 TaxID=3081286 RepID=UPI003017B5B1